MSELTPTTQFQGTVIDIENKSNKTDTIDGNSTGEQYPSALAVAKAVETKSAAYMKVWTSTDLR